MRIGAAVATIDLSVRAGFITYATVPPGPAAD